jgi:hypothetical protein
MATSGLERRQTGVPTAPQVAYAVTGHPVGVYVDASQYEVGQEVTFLVTGPPNTAIHWSSTVNGQPSGETDAFYNQYTDSNGIFTSTAPWTDPRTGAWIKRVTVAGQTSEVGFEVAGPPPPPPPPPPVKLDKTSAATGSDGRTYLFALRADNRVVTREQQGGGWSDWYPVGDRTATIPPTASVNSQGRVEVYAVGTDNAVYRSVSNGAGPGGWSGWNTVGQCCIVSRVSVVQDRFGRMNVFGRGTDNAIYFSRESTPGSGAWTGWQSLGPHIISAPAAVRNSDGWIRVFGVSGDNNVWVKDLVDIAPDNRQISGWTGMGGGPVVGDPAVAGPIVTVFVRRPDNLIYATHSQGAAWRPWISVGGGALVSDPVAISHPNGASPTVFALGTDQQVYASRLTCFGGGWACFETTYSGWQAIGSGPFAVPPALTALPDGRFQALGLAPDRRAFVNSQVAVQTVNFTGWSPL